ncbi:MAG: tRNA 5-methylaminomethyl-2-thiouridine biosynthesis bifunctional protein, partial [Francisellaceae bacterium]
LNFLSCWKLFEETNNDNLSLDFISVEKYPLSCEQLTQALSLWPDLNDYTQQLINHYPEIYNGTVQIFFSDKVTLTLIFDDAYKAYSRREQKIDAWFLDGFSPSKNCEMWSDNLFDEIGRLSYSTTKNATTIATFTAASLVRKNLIRIGFNIEKRKGFGKKREMLTGAFLDKTLKYKTTIPAYYSIPSNLSIKDLRVAIVGSGLAGCAMAYEFAKFGIKSDIYEKNTDIAMGASGNEAGIAHPYLSLDGNVSDLLFTQGFLQLNKFLKQNENKIAFHNQPTIVEFNKRKNLTYYEKLLSGRNISSNIASVISAGEASKISGIDINESMLLYPSAISINPKELCQLWLNLSVGYNQIFFDHQVLDIKKTNVNWQLIFSSGEIKKYDSVIFAGGYDQFQNLSLLDDIKVESAGGQVDIIVNSQLKCTYINSNYFVPLDKNKLLIGATFRPDKDLSNEFRQQDFNNNMRGLPFGVNKDNSLLFSRASTRCTTLDHLPIIGALPNFELFESYYKDNIKNGTVDNRMQLCPYHQGLYISSGFGSKGLSGSLLSAQIIRALILNKNLPICSSIYKAIHPGRFRSRGFR